MGCYIGEGIYRRDNCSAVITSNGHPGEEKTAFSDTSEFTVYVLRTISDCAGIGGEPCVLYFFGNGVWTELIRQNTSSYYGYAYSSWRFLENSGSGWFKNVWGDCSRIFKTGSPSGRPCSLASNVSIQFVSSATLTGFAGYVIRIVNVADASEEYTQVTDDDGVAKFDSLCAGTYSVYLGTEYHGDKALATDSAIVFTLTNTPVSQPITAATAKKLIDTAIAAEKQERETADTSLAGTIAGLVGQITDAVAAIASETKARIDAIADVWNKLDDWLVSRILDIIWKALKAEKGK